MLRLIGGSLGEILGMLDDGGHGYVQGEGVVDDGRYGRNEGKGRKTVDAATILTTWSRILPRTVVPLTGENDENGLVKQTGKQIQQQKVHDVLV